MEVTKLSDFLKQQGDTPQGKSTYQAFIDNWEPSRLDVWADNKGSEISAAFLWADTPEGIYFWDNISENRKKTLEFESENDMLWLLDGKEPPKETDGEDELEERRRKEAVTPTEQPPILPIRTNQLLDTEETKKLDEAAKAIDPFGYYEGVGINVENLKKFTPFRQFIDSLDEGYVALATRRDRDIRGSSQSLISMATTEQEKQPVGLFNSTSDGYSLQAEMFGDGSIMITGAGTIPHKKEATSYILYDEVADKDSGCDQVDGKNHLDTILAERAAKYGPYKAQAKCVGDIILATQEVAKANSKQQTAEQIGSIAYLAIKIARYANGETGDTLDDLEGYIKLIREMEQKDDTIHTK